jgi:uncharacterized protein (TIGR03067 family)
MIANESQNQRQAALRSPSKGWEWTVSFAPAVESAEGNTVAAVTYKSIEQETRVVTIDNNGQEHQSSRRQSTGIGDVTQSVHTFDKLPINRIKEVRFQARPYQWVEFRNVSLSPLSGKVPAERPTGSASRSRSGTPVPDNAAESSQDVRHGVPDLRDADNAAEPSLDVRHGVPDLRATLPAPVPATEESDDRRRNAGTWKKVASSTCEKMFKNVGRSPDGKTEFGVPMTREEAKAADREPVKITKHSLFGLQYTLDPSKNPKAIDLALDGTVVLIGIYEFLGDRLQFRFSRGPQRPTTFAHEPDDDDPFMVLQRATDADNKQQ